MSTDIDKHLAAKKWGCISAALGIVGTLIGFTVWSMKQKADELKGPPVTITVQAELDPSMESETITVQFHRDGGSFLSERKLPSGTINLSRSNPKGTAEIVLPGSGNVRYEVVSECWLDSANRTQGFCRRKNENENDSMIPGEPLLVQGNATLHVIRSVSENNVYVTRPDSPLAFRYTARLQAKPGPNPEAFGKLVKAAALIREKDVAFAAGQKKGTIPPKKETAKSSPPKAEPTPDDAKASADGRVWTAKKVSYELVEAVRDGDAVTLTIQAVNAGADKDVPLALADTRMVDDQGDPHQSAGATVGRQAHDAPAAVTIPLPQDTRVRFRVRFDGVGPAARVLSSFSLAVDGMKLAYKNVPVGGAVAAAPPTPAPPTPAPVPAPPAPPSNAPGTIVIRSKDKLVAAVTVEVDGKKAADWPKDSLDVKVTVPPGKHRVVVRSVFKERFLSQAFDDVVVKPGGEAELLPDAVKPDAPQRVSWSHKEATYTYLNGGRWLEVAGTARHNFTETARVTDYIELYDANRDCTLRLYDTTVHLKGLPGYTNFREYLSGGKWVK